MLEIGAPAPSFALASDTGHIVRSDALKGQRYVLYFYPKDDTPGCTKEACAFRDQIPDFARLGVPVFGVSADGEAAHAKFVRKYQLNFPLLSDPDHELLEAYGAWVEKSLYGRKYMGIQRCTFVVDGRGRIEQVWAKVKPESHAAEVAAYLRGDAETAAPAKTTGKATKKATAPRTTPKKVAGKASGRSAAKAPAKKAATPRGKR